MAKIRLSRIKSSAFKISSYAGSSVDLSGLENWPEQLQIEAKEMLRYFQRLI